MLFILFVISAAMYAAFQMFAAYDTYWTFEKDVETLVRFASANMSSGRQQKLVHKIDGMLDDMGVQYNKKKDVNVTVNEGTEHIAVDVRYSQHINLPYYPNPKQFHLHVEGNHTVG